MEENTILEPEKKPEKKRKWLPKFVVVALLILIVGASLSGNDSVPSSGNNSTPSETTSVPPQKSVEELKITAYVMSQDFLNDQLKSPATAKYPLMREIIVIDQGEGVYVVKAYVDAENSFGAKIRTQYTATVQNTEGEMWKLLDLQVE